MLVSEAKIKPPIGKKRATCTRCLRLMISVHYKDYKARGSYKFKRIGFYCKKCDILYPIESNTD